MSATEEKTQIFSNFLRLIPIHEHTIISRLAKNNIRQLSADTGCCLEESQRAMASKNG